MLTLEELVERDGPLSVRDALGWTLRLSLAIARHHRAGAPHGRVSAGAVEVEAASCRSQARLLRSTECEEAPPYHSLTRGRGGEPSSRDDVWALGITLYFLLTGKLPYPKGVVAAVEDDRVRPAPPLALAGAQLDVMQPIIDRLIRPDAVHLVLTTDQVVDELRRFSPANADLPPLLVTTESLAPEPVREKVDDPEPVRRARAAVRRRNLLLAIIALGFVALIVVIFFVNDSMPPPIPPDARTPVASGSATAEPSVATSGPPAVSADIVASPPPVSGPGNMAACIAPLFPDGGVPPDAELGAFACDERDPRELSKRITAAVAKVSAGQATPATREWSQLGWYKIGAVAVARERCCGDSAAALETPSLFSLCEMDEALVGLGNAVVRGDDDAASAAISRFRRAAACTHTAGGGPSYGESRGPGSEQGTVFVRMVARYRSNQR